VSRKPVRTVDITVHATELGVVLASDVGAVLLASADEVRAGFRASGLDDSSVAGRGPAGVAVKGRWLGPSVAAGDVGDDELVRWFAPVFREVLPPAHPVREQLLRGEAGELQRRDHPGNEWSIETGPYGRVVRIDDVEVGLVATEAEFGSWAREQHRPVAIAGPVGIVVSGRGSEIAVDPTAAAMAVEDLAAWAADMFPADDPCLASVLRGIGA
jgi:hypothetical protein